MTHYEDASKQSRSGRGVRRAGALGLLVVAAACTVPQGTSSSSSSTSGGAPPSGPAFGSTSSYTRLTRGTHPYARPELQIGHLPPEKRLENLSIVFKPSREQLAERDALVAAVTDPGSPSFRKWLTPEVYAARFGAKAADIARTKAWLASRGLEVKDTSRLGARVSFAGTVAAVEAAFQAQMNLYSVGGETHYAMSPAPSVPSDMADFVLAVKNTHDFYPRHSKARIKRTPTATCPSGDSFCSGNGIAPSDWATIYDVNPLYSTGIAGTKINGTGVTIAIVGISAIAQADLTAFRTRYNLNPDPNNITMTLVPGTGVAQGDNGASLEAVLDTEWAGGIAPSATINYVYTGANDTNVDDATYYAIEQNFGGILSESWAGCEAGATPSDADVLETFGSAASLEGITYVAASGDDGAAACQGRGGLYVNMPASFPGVTAIGGTGFSTSGGLTFDGSGNVTGTGTEAVWNELHNAYTTGVASGGGGISSVFTRPTYQSSVPTCTSVGSLPTGVTPSSMREIPDVSLTAASGRSQYGYFIECTFDSGTDDCTSTGTSPVVVEIGGTSASTPSFAGVMALANQAVGGRLGNINPLLYALNSTTPSAFHDITTGNNEVTCKSGTDPGCPAGKLYGYAAASGYDCATGLGSIDATKLVSAWAALTPTTTSLSPSTSSTLEGQSVTLTATVNSGSSPNVVGGIVTFGFQSYLANGNLDLSWTLGTATITGGTTTTGTATLTTAIPPGLVKPGQAVDVVAMYGGDANHLGSVSTKSNITFSPISTFCVTPATKSVAAGAGFTFAPGGGVAPVRWYISSDSTCSTSGTNCSSVNVTTGAFIAGTGAAGYVIVSAIDADGAEVFSEVTVGSPGGTAPWGSGSGIVTNACCVPLTTCPGGDNCGTIPDGCGGTVSCGGACTLPQTCGGGGTANVCGTPAGPTVTTNASSYTTSEAITVTWSGLPGNPTDFVTIAPQGSSITTISTWVYTGGAVAGGNTFSAGLSTPGTYVARAYADGQWDLLDESAPFTVSSPSATVTTDKGSYGPGDNITVSWTGMPGDANDFVVLTPQGSPTTTMTTWAYTGGSMAGSHTFVNALATPGTYVARTYVNGTWTVAGESAPFTVSTPSVTVTTDKSSYGPGDNVTVTWSGLPGDSNDFITLAPQGSGSSTVLTWAYTGGAASGSHTFVAAITAPGSYVARAFPNGTFTVAGESPAFTVAASTATISTDMSSYAIGQNITVNWTGLPGNATDWISLAPQGSAYSTVTTWIYSGGAVSGSNTFVGGIAASGTYVARAFSNGSYSLLVEGAPFTVQ